MKNASVSFEALLLVGLLGGLLRVSCHMNHHANKEI